MFEMYNCAHPTRWPVAPHVKHLQSSVIRELLKVSSLPGVISFAGGLPAPELFPLEKIKEICGMVIDEHKHASVQ
jgi:2-aminoadipate transaminase